MSCWNSRWSDAVVVGYASVDTAVVIDRPIAPGETSQIVSQRPGVDKNGLCQEPGGIAYTAAALAGGGVSTSAITWVGPDGPGAAYQEALSSRRVDTSTIAVTGTTTPGCILVYAPDDRCTCLFNPGDGDDTLDVRQRQAIKASKLVVMMIAPKAATVNTLQELKPAQQLAWVMKADPSAHPTELMSELAARADYIFCNEYERDLIRPLETKPSATIINSRGPNSIIVESAGKHFDVDPIGDPIEVDNYTGAGDTLAGATLATLCAGSPIAAAVTVGMQAARSLLANRT